MLILGTIGGVQGGSATAAAGGGITASAVLPGGPIGTDTPHAAGALKAADTSLKAGAPETAAAPHEAAPPHEAVALSAGVADVTDWTSAEAIAGLTADAIFTIPGSVATLDEPVVEPALAGTGIQVLILPHNGLDKADREVHADKTDEVQEWANDRDITLMVIDGMQVYLPPLYNLVPTDLGELQPMLMRHDLTSMVLSGIDRLVADAAEVDYLDQRPDPVLESPGTADPESVTAVGDALATNKLYTAPGLDPPIVRNASWDIDLTTRVAVFPVLKANEPLTALTAELADRFPDDVVIVARGEWLEVAGPQQELLDAALLELYGEYYTAISEWGAPLTGLIRILIEKIGVWRSGVVADLAPPAAAPDPVNTIEPLLPWLFLLVALVIAGIVAAGLRRRQIRTRTGKTRDRHDFVRASAEMAIIAQRLQLADDPESGTGSTNTKANPTAADLARASERYRTARDILQRKGSTQVAREALTTAAQMLTEAGVPAPVGGATPFGADDPVRRTR